VRVRVRVRVRERERESKRGWTEEVAGGQRGSGKPG
jgi:hypothetical protein